MITCREISETTSDYLDGPTTWTQRIGMQLHLLICKHCRRYFQQFKITIGVAKNISAPVEPTDQEIDALVQRLVAQNSE